MPAHLAPRHRRHRVLGALSVAVGIALLTMGFLSFGGGDDQAETALIDDATEPTVLGVEIDRDEVTTTASLPEAPAAVPATFSLGTTGTTSGSGSTSSPSPTTSTTGPAVIGPPVVITVPTTRPSPTTTEPTSTTTTTDGSTTTTEDTTSTTQPE